MKTIRVASPAVVRGVSAVLVGFCAFGAMATTTLGTAENAACAAIWLKAEDGTKVTGFVVDGVEYAGDVTIYPESYPTQFHVRAVLAEGQHLLRYRKTCSDPSVLSGSLDCYPGLDESVWLVPPAEIGVTLTCEFQVAARTLWVDQKNESGTEDGTPEHPFVTIQDAVDAVNGTERTCIFVKPGEYGSGVTDSGSGRFRVAITGERIMRIKAVEGPEKTVIRGESDPEHLGDADYPGCGANAVQCVLYAAGSYGFQLQGFTLADGRSLGGGAAVYANIGGAYRFWLDDCIVTNCFSNLRVCYGGNLVANRTRFIDCLSGRFINEGVSVSSYYRGCVSRSTTSGDGLVGGEEYGCTLVGAIRTDPLNGAILTWNTIADGGGAAYSGTTGGYVLYNNCGGKYLKDENLYPYYYGVDPKFADRAASGLVREDSPAVTFAELPSGDHAGSGFWKYFGGDIEGRGLAFNSEGRFITGAYQRTVPVVTVSVAAPANGGFVVTTGTTGVNTLVGSGEIVIAPAAGTRPCAGVLVGGETNLFESAEGHVITLPFESLRVKGRTIAVEAFYTTDWYVDADHGNDANNGMFPSAARRTLAMALPSCANGDTLWALPGSYDDGTMTIAGSSLATRAVVPAGVTLRSVGGAAVTKILGAAATDPDEYGCGTDAVRCVALAGADAKVMGFTLEGGRVNLAAGELANYAGGGVYSNNEDGSGRDPTKGYFVEDCLITNCVAREGAAACRVTLVRCKVVGNATAGATDGSLVYQGSSYGSYIDRNRLAAVTCYVFSYPLDIVGSTIGPDNVTSAGSMPYSVTYSSRGSSDGQSGLFLNSLFCQVTTPGGSYTTTIRNCIFRRGSDLSAHTDIDDTVVASADPAELVIDDGRPLPGQCIAIDAGDAAWLDRYGILGRETDLSGGQRIYNARVDVGAYEYDWRARYAAILAGRKATVTEATPGVRETSTPAVLIPDGNRIALALDLAGRTDLVAQVKGMVTGSGTLAVKINGETVKTWTAADGDFTWKGPALSDPNAVTLSFEGDGLAEVRSCRAVSVGLVILFR